MKLLYLLLMFCIVSTSCKVERASRFVYASQAANVNYFTKKGDAKITGYYSGDGKEENGGVNVQAGYAISNHIAIMASYTNKWETQTYRYDSVRFSFRGNIDIVETNIFDSSVIKYKRNNFEISIGYFVPLNKKKTTTYNVYVGTILGKFSIYDIGLDSNNKQYTKYYDAKPTKYFLQGSFNFMPSKNFHCSIGGNFSLLNFKSINTTYKTSELNYFYLDRIERNTLLLWEPYFNMQFRVPKYPWLKIDTQFSTTATSFGYNYPKAKTFNASIGLTIQLSKK